MYGMCTSLPKGSCADGSHYGHARSGDGGRVFPTPTEPVTLKHSGVSRAQRLVGRTSVGAKICGYDQRISSDGLCAYRDTGSDPWEDAADYP
ncbi:MAG: hypothetical protein Ct9H300mP11_33100 [Chloroflexota bacterium]|nr:MAG: hypothetical protein Ct9H300mP11_33100 [Chloroflexota bacterium]